MDILWCCCTKKYRPVMKGKRRSNTHSAWMILTEPGHRALHSSNTHGTWMILTESGHRDLHSSNIHSAWMILTEPRHRVLHSSNTHGTWMILTEPCTWVSTLGHLCQILDAVNSVERAEGAGQQEEAPGGDRHASCLNSDWD